MVHYKYLIRNTATPQGLCTCQDGFARFSIGKPKSYSLEGNYSMLQHILVWGFIGLYIGQLASQYMDGGRWNGHNGDLVLGVIGSFLGGTNWFYNGQPEGMLGVILYGAIGSLALLLLVRIVAHKPSRKQLFQLWTSFDNDYPTVSIPSDKMSVRSQTE